MSAQDSNAEIFHVFLCHNSEDKLVVREISQKLAEKDIKPWLDEEQIRPGTSWQTALGQQIESIKSAAIFVGESGFGPWQNQEIQALLTQFVERACPVIPAILPSAKTTPSLPWTLSNLHWTKPLRGMLARPPLVTNQPSHAQESLLDPMLGIA